MKRISKAVILSISCLAFLFGVTAITHAQTTALTYQGKLSEGGNAANGTYDMQFNLFDTPAVGEDVGFGAQDLEKVEPLPVNHSKSGEVEGVKYGQLTTNLVNAVLQQQKEIATQQRTIAELKRQVDMMQRRIGLRRKNLVNPSHAFGKPPTHYPRKDLK